ncbi:hypothetical protein ACRRGZ_003822 [Escherichia coli]
MPNFYIDTDNTFKRYDPAKFMEFKEEFGEYRGEYTGLYDEFSSYFIDQLRKLPKAGDYIIHSPYRPDIYSRFIYGKTEYWQLILYYNNIVEIKDLMINKVLCYPSIASIENLYFTLKVNQK